MISFLESAVIAAVVSSTANLIIGYKALTETRKLTREKRHLEFLERKKEKLEKFLSELKNFKFKVGAKDLINLTKSTEAIDKVVQDSILVDYPNLKRLFDRLRLDLDEKHKINIENKINEIDTMLDEIINIIAEGHMGKKTKEQIDKYNKFIIEHPEVLTGNFVLHFKEFLINEVENNITEINTTYSNYLK